MWIYLLWEQRETYIASNIIIAKFLSTALSIHTYVHTYTHTHTRIYIYVYLHAYTYIMCVYIYIYIYISSSCLLALFVYSDWGFPCFSLSSKANAKCGTASILPSFFVALCIILFCVVLCIVCVQMCTVLLQPGSYPTVVKNISY